VPNLTPSEWAGELIYCRQLVARNGDHNVPRNILPSYLKTQIAQAKHDKRPDMVKALTKLQSQVQ
jgi:hypothetical protein